MRRREAAQAAAEAAERAILELEEDHDVAAPVGKVALKLGAKTAPSRR